MLKNCLYYYTAINILQSGCSEPVENVTINRNHFGVCFADCPLYGTGFAKNSTILRQIRLSRFCVPESQSGVGFFFFKDTFIQVRSLQREEQLSCSWSAEAKKATRKPGRRWGVKLPMAYLGFNSWKRQEHELGFWSLADEAANPVTSYLGDWRESQSQEWNL